MDGANALVGDGSVGGRRHTKMIADAILDRVEASKRAGLVVEYGTAGW
jgi:hypothetical protein